MHYMLTKRMNWGSLGAIVVRKVLFLVWIANGAVQMLTTLHEVGGEHRIVKLRPCSAVPRPTEQGRGNYLETRRQKMILVPTDINDYNTNMGAVDIADQQHSAYRTNLKRLLSWPPVLFWLRDVSLSNSYLTMASKHPGKW